MATSKVKRKVPALEKRVLDHLKRAAKEDVERRKASDTLLTKTLGQVRELLDQAEEIKDGLDEAKDKVSELQMSLENSVRELRTDHDEFRRDISKMHKRMGALRNVVLKYIPKGESA